MEREHGIVVKGSGVPSICAISSSVALDKLLTTLYLSIITYKISMRVTASTY